MFKGCALQSKNGKVNIKKYKSTKDVMYQIASCSKFVTALVVAKLYELQLLDYDTDINKYVKQWKCPVEGITLRHLLMHTSGSTDKNGYLGEEPLIKIVQSLQTNINIITGNSYSKPFNVVNQPGVFLYSGAGYQVVQQVLEEITGKRLYQLMNEYIFHPLQMNNSTGKLLYPNKHKYVLANMSNLYRMYAETAAAGVWMSCADLHKLLSDILSTYNTNTGKILQQETLIYITKDAHSELNNSYGLGIFAPLKKGKNI